MEVHARAGAVEIACWTIGLALCALYALARADATTGSAGDLARFEQLGDVESAGPQAAGPDGDFRPYPDNSPDTGPNTGLWSSSRLERYRASAPPPAKAMIGVLVIPALDLKAPVYAEASEPYLNRGVGLIAGMDPVGAAGNVGIAGHRDGFFRALKDIAPGDEIVLRTRERIYRYRVSQISVVERSDASALRSSVQPALTLVTCHPFYFVGPAPRRFVVRGALSSSRPVSTRPVSTRPVSTTVHRSS